VRVEVGGKGSRRHSADWGSDERGQKDKVRGLPLELARKRRTTHGHLNDLNVLGGGGRQKILLFKHHWRVLYPNRRGDRNNQSELGHVGTGT